MDPEIAVSPCPRILEGSTLTAEVAPAPAAQFLCRLRFAGRKSMELAIAQEGLRFGFSRTRNLSGSSKLRCRHLHHSRLTMKAKNPIRLIRGSSSLPSPSKKGERNLQNVDLPPLPPRSKKKPYPVPLKKMQRAAKELKKQAQMGIERQLDPPKNGLLVPELVPVAYEVLEQWKILIKGLKQLLNFVPVYGCRYCSEVHVGPVGHEIADCLGSGNSQRRSLHSWVRGSVNDVLLPIESYHVYDPFGHRIKHEDRFSYDRIPAVVELCIQAGVEIPQYPTRRRTRPIRMMGKKIIDLGDRVKEPPPCREEEAMNLLSELDTYSPAEEKDCFFIDPEDQRVLAEKTLKAYRTVRRGLRKLMGKYTVKACGYCSEVHVGPFGHDVKLCGEFKHQWRDGKHGWQDATVDEVMPPNYVWHLPEKGSDSAVEAVPPSAALKRFYGKAPAVVEICVQAGAAIPAVYRPMMRLDIIIPDSDETRLVA